MLLTKSRPKKKKEKKRSKEMHPNPNTEETQCPDKKTASGLNDS